jgi:hypothetical protein
MSVEDLGALASPAPSPAAPVRPAPIPAEAIWNDRSGEWELAALDHEGRREGLVRSWRSDGTLATEYHHRAGERDGAFTRYHPDGSVAREGVFVDGQPHGTVVAHGHAGPTPEPLQSCCVPEGAWQLQHDYDQGHLSEVRWYDRAGVHILPSGKPHPRRPDGVPRQARYEEARDQWVLARYSDTGSPDGVWERWARDGVLRERDEYRDGKAHGLWQRFDAVGALTEEGEWREGTRTGAYRRLGVPAELYTDARVHEERGAFARDQTVGTWSLHDAAGAPLGTFELGAALDEDALRASPVLADGPVSATRAAWEETARALAAERRPAEALLATARAAAKGADAAPLREGLARLTLPRQAESARGLATDLVARADGRLDVVANGLPAGADAVSLLRALASSLTGRDLVALELCDAALLLDPARDECHLTRALVNVHLGRPDDARADAAALDAELVEQRDFLASYTRVIFTEFPFVPAQGDLRTQFPDVPEAPEQPLDEVVAQIRKYATRLLELRAAVSAHLPPGAAPPWLPPDLSALLPDGPVPLERWEFEEVIEDEDEVAGAESEHAAPPAPAQPTLVTVDERLKLEPDVSLPSLMRLARREWNGLTWLCWSAGLERVALPTALSPPPAFGVAAGMSIERLWRCRDRKITGGLRAMTQGVPGFIWEGTEIDLLPIVLAEIAADEYLEMRAIFYWLCDAGVQSPWQDNLRGAT